MNEDQQVYAQGAEAMREAVVAWLGTHSTALKGYWHCDPQDALSAMATLPYMALATKPAPSAGAEAVNRAAVIAIVKAEQRYEGSDFPVCNSIVRAVESLPALTAASDECRGHGLADPVALKPKVLRASEAVRGMMERLGIKGSFAIHQAQVLDAGWVGKPGADDYEVFVTITPLPAVAWEPEVGSVAALARAKAGVL
jgi:hypothetical protein